MIELEAIIKDKKRYKLIKFPKGMDLTDCKVEKRSSNNLGVSTKRFGKNWFVTKRGKALFKNYDIDKTGLRIVNELLYDELAKQIGLPVAEYLPADYKSYPIEYLLRVDKDQIKKPDPEEIVHGLVSIKVTKSNEQLFSGQQLLDYDSFWGAETLEDYMKALDIFEEGEGYYVDKRGIKSQFYKMMTLDYLTFMEDRHCMNVCFIKNDKDRYLIAAPVIDNEMCFAGKSLWLDGQYDGKYLSDISLKEFLAIHAKGMRLFVNNETDYTALSSAKEVYETNVKALVELATKSKNMKKFLSETVENIDINKAFENVEKQGYEVTPEYKEYVNNLMKVSTGMFKKYMKEFDIQKQAETEKDFIK